MIDDIDANFVPTFFYSLKTFFNNQSQGENKDYLLISIDKANIYWMIKIPNNILSNDFLTLLNYILPFNVNINGFLFLGSMKPQDMENKVLIYYESIKSLKVPIYQKFYIFSLTNKDIGEESKVEVNGKYCQIEKNRLKMLINIKYIKFDNLTETINEQFIIISTNICPLLITNRSNFLINESFSNSLGVYYSDFNILIESLEYLTEEERSSYQLSYLKQAELAKTSNRINITLLINTSIENDTYFEETNNIFYSVYQDIQGEQVIKPSKLSIVAVFPKKKFDIISNTKQYLSYFESIFKQLYELNMKSSTTYSLFTFSGEDIPIPLNILYSYRQKYEEFEESLLSQRIYFYEIFNLSKKSPSIRKFKLEKAFFNLNQCVNELSTNERYDIHLIRNLHKEMKVNYSSTCVLIKGDYDFYHAAHEHINDRGWGTGYRSLQTLLSYYSLNGFANIEIPRLLKIQELLVNLGISPSSTVESNKAISLTDISMCLGYYIDLEQEIFCFKNLQEFVQNINLVAHHLINLGSPILVGTYLIYSIIGIDFDPSLKLLVIYHNYSGSDSIIGVNKSFACKWVEPNELFLDNDLIEILLPKINFTI